MYSGDELIVMSIDEYLDSEVNAVIERIDCRGLSITTDELEKELDPFRCLNGLYDELTFLFEFIEDRKAEELEERGRLLSI